MLTLTLQNAGALLGFLFGAVAYVVSRSRAQIPEGMRRIWALVGVSFLLLGGSVIVQSVGASWAFFAGPASPVYAMYLAWVPPLTYGRLFAGILMGGMLLTAVRRDRKAPTIAQAVAVLLLGMVLGAALGGKEGSFEHSRHFPLNSTLSVVQLLLLLTAVAGALISQCMDRLLWGSLLVYVIGLAIAITMTSSLSWFGIDGAWSPAPWLLQVCYTLMFAAMLGLAGWRLLLARRGRPVPPPFRPAERRASLMGWE